MRIDFNNLDHTAIPGFKGGEGKLDAQMFVDQQGKILIGRLDEGSTVGLHTHEGSYEVIYVLSGTGYAITDGQREELEPGVCTYCPEGSAHELHSNGPEDLVFFAAVPELG